MIERLVYESAQGQRFDFNSDGVITDTKGLRDYDWKYTVAYNTAGLFENVPVEKTIKSVFYSNDPITNAIRRNSAYELFDTDVKAETPGRLYLGDYYIWCYIFGAKNGTDRNGTHISTEWEIVTYLPTWRKDNHKSFRIKNDMGTGGIDFPFDFPFDYMERDYSADVYENPSPFPSDFEITIHGPAINPYVMIGGNIYGVNCTIYEGDTLVISSITKICKILRDGEEHENVISKRMQEQSIFTKIPGNNSSVSWDGSFDWSLFTYDDRSEPPFDPIITESGEQVSVSVYLTSDGFIYGAIE